MEHYNALTKNDSVSLDKWIKSVDIKLIKFDELVSLDGHSYLKRYSPLIIEVRNNSDADLGIILISVIRTNSKVGNDNRFSVPMNTSGLKPGSKAWYKLFVFDPFATKFKDIHIRLTNTQDWADRPIGPESLQKAAKFTKKLKWYHRYLKDGLM